MARYRRRRTYFRRKSGRWAPNIVKISSTNNASVGEFYNYEDLAVNPIQTSTGVSQTFTIKNIEISFTIEGGVTSSPVFAIESVTAYVMYVPQGMSITSSYYAEHPEYIMAYKYLGSPSLEYAPTGSTPISQQYQPFKIRTRMSRKLQTGDRVILYIQGSNEDTQTRQYKIDGLVRWWSKAN